MWKMDLDIEQQTVVAIGWNGIYCVIIFLICIASFYQLCIKDSSSWIDLRYRNLTIITIASLSIVSIVDVVHLSLGILCWNPNRTKFTHSEAIIAATNDTIYYFGTIAFYLLLLLRVKIAFKLNMCIVYIFRLFISISALSAGVYCSILFYFRKHTNDAQRYLALCLIPLSVNDFILNVSLLVLFVYNMKKHMKGILIEITSLNHTKHVNVISNIMVKHAILFSLAVITNQLFFVWTLVVMILYNGQKHNTMRTTGLTLVYMARAVANCINVIVLWLILRVNYDEYICLCRYCHLRCSKCCTKSNSDPLENPYMQFKELDSHKTMT